MKHFLLVGNYSRNAGPANVNRSLIESADKSMIYIRFNSRYLRRLEQLLKCVCYHTIVFSGGVPSLEFSIGRLLRKRIVYIMHGCSKYENVINRLELSEKKLMKEQMILKYVTKIVAVSTKYAEWVKREFPEYAHKVTYVNNSLEISECFFSHLAHTDTKRIVALTGGNRPQKRNYIVCQAIEKLNAEGWNISVYVFGRLYKNGESIFNFSFVERMGHMDKTMYYEELKRADLVCINSELESFGLVVGDALNCGCGLLMSENVGATSIFDSLKDEDIIYDSHNVDEICSKIEYLLNKSNAYRLFCSVDKEKCSNRYAYLRLKEICVNE